jgi:hypothetical protein
MALNTYSAFIYGHSIDTNTYLDFDEGSGPIFAQLNVGEYTLTDFATEIARAMNGVSAIDYTVSVNRSTGILTITAASGTFKILGSSGTHVGADILPLAGFNNSDTGFAIAHTGNFRSGSIWEPQMKGQDYVAFDDQQKAVDGVVKKSASGNIETVRFGNEKIMDINFRFNTDITMTDDCWIRNDPEGVSKLRTFMEYAVTKADLEFIPDKAKPDIYFEVILESTPESQDGLGFKLKEQYDKGLPGYFDTGVLKFRLLN